jgi:hypothetical protein
MAQLSMPASAQSALYQRSRRFADVILRPQILGRRISLSLSPLCSFSSAQVNEPHLRRLRSGPVLGVSRAAIAVRRAVKSR